MVNWLLVLVAVAFGVGRFSISIPPHPLSLPGTYEAFAHLFIGGLIGAWLASKNRFYLFLFLILTIVELVAFFSK